MSGSIHNATGIPRESTGGTVSTENTESTDNTKNTKSIQITQIAESTDNINTTSSTDSPSSTPTSAIATSSLPPTTTLLLLPNITNPFGAVSIFGGKFEPPDHMSQSFEEESTLSSIPTLTISLSQSSRRSTSTSLATVSDLLEVQWSWLLLISPARSTRTLTASTTSSVVILTKAVAPMTHGIVTSTRTFEVRTSTLDFSGGLNTTSIIAGPRRTHIPIDPPRYEVTGRGWEAWSPRHKVGAVIGAVAGPLIALSLLLWWLRSRRDLRSENAEEYDEEGGGKGAQNPEEIFAASAQARTEAGTIWRNLSGKRFAQMDHESCSSINRDAVQKITGTDESTSSKSFNTASNGTNGSTLLGSAGSARNSTSESNVSVYRVNAHGSTAHESARSISTESPSSENCCNGETPYLPYPLEDTSFYDPPIGLADTKSDLQDGFSATYQDPTVWFRGLDIPGINGKTSSAIMTEMYPDHIPTGVQQCAVANRSRHPRAFGRGVPPSVVRRNTVRPSNKSPRIVPAVRFENEDSMGDQVDRKELVQHHMVQNDHAQEYGSWKERLRGELPVRWG